jgi:hypothetical protein
MLTEQSSGKTAKRRRRNKEETDVKVMTRTEPGQRKEVKNEGITINFINI